MKYYIRHHRDDVNNPNLEITLSDRRPRTDEYSPRGGFETRDAALAALKAETAMDFPPYPENYGEVVAE